MKKHSNKIVGQTRDVGFQIGVRRTLSIRHEDAWRLLTSRKGVRLWLGNTSGLKFTKGAAYKLADGSFGEVRVFKPNSHLRITWQIAGRERPSTIQLRVIPKDERTVVAFHQENLPGSKEREKRRTHYSTVLDELERLIQHG